MTTSAATIRTLLPDEIDLWRTIRLRALNDAPDAFGTTYEEATAWSDAEWAAQVERSTSSGTQVTYLAESGSAVVGCARVSRDTEIGVATVTSMWVDPAGRRQGIAVALLEACEGWARASGCVAVELEVAELNPGARLLYERAGFVETGEILLLRDGSTARTVHMARTLEEVKSSPPESPRRDLGK